MLSSEAIKFVNQALANGYTIEQIKELLLQKGVTQVELDKFFPSTTFSKNINSQDHFLLVSPLKFILFSIFSLGIFEFVYFWRMWRSIKRTTGENIKPFWRTIFTVPFFLFSFFKYAKSLDEQSKTKPGLFTFLYLIFSILYFGSVLISKNTIIIYLFWFLNLIIPLAIIVYVQNSINQHWPKEYSIKKKFSKKEILFLVLGIAFTSIVIVISYFPYIPIKIMQQIQYSKEKYPQAYVVPKERMVNAPAILGDKLTFDGITFNVPWKNLERSFMFGDGLLVYNYPNSKIIGIHTVKHSNQFNLAKSNIKMISQLSEPEKQKIIKAYGGEGVYNNSFEFANYLNNIKPDSGEWFGDVEKLSAIPVLVIQKTAFTPEEAKSGIYKFSISRFKGFQYGDPSYTSTITIQIFDTNNTQYELLIKGKMSQNDIDTILSTFDYNPLLPSDIPTVAADKGKATSSKTKNILKPSIVQTSPTPSVNPKFISAGEIASTQNALKLHMVNANEYTDRIEIEIDTENISLKDYKVTEFDFRMINTKHGGTCIPLTQADSIIPANRKRNIKLSCQKYEQGEINNFYYADGPYMKWTTIKIGLLQP